MNELKIILFPENRPRNFFNTRPVSVLNTDKTLAYSFDQYPALKLGCMESNAPVLSGFYEAHKNHLPLRIKPDNIQLLIVQAFSNHVNANSEELKSCFVNFEGKNNLEIIYDNVGEINVINRNVVKDITVKINKEMEKYIDKKLLNTLTPNFTTTNYDSLLICKMSIMGEFKEYFNSTTDFLTCGIPYIILEGTTNDYKEVLEKSKKLAKYNFKWYTDRIREPIQKMIVAKEGRIDTEFFRRMIKRKCQHFWSIYGQPNGKDTISGWIIKFFSYYNKMDRGVQRNIIKGEININEFCSACQMLNVPFKIKFKNGCIITKEYDMNYKVGFVGCHQNNKSEISLVSGWFIEQNRCTDTKGFNNMKNFKNYDSFEKLLNSQYQNTFITTSYRDKQLTQQSNKLLSFQSPWQKQQTQQNNTIF